MQLVAGRELNLAFLMIVVRLLHGRKLHISARKPGGGVTQSIIKLKLKVWKEWN